MKSISLISVIIPTYNRSHLISRAIESVINQTYGNWELLVVDDASTDNTEEVVKSFKDPRIRFIGYKKNGGNAVARNVGVESSKGDYIAFLDSDDEFLENFLEKAIFKLKSNHKAFFLWSGTRTVNPDDSYYDRIWTPSTAKNPNQFLYELHVGIGRGFLIKKECFDNLKFDENLRTAVDTDFLIRLRQNYDFTVLEEIMLYIHTQPGSVRSDFSEKKKSYDIIIEKNKETILEKDVLRFKWYYKLLWLSLYDNDFHLAKRAYSKIRFAGIKPTILYMLFKIFPNKKARKFHKKLSS